MLERYSWEAGDDMKGQASEGTAFMVSLMFFMVILVWFGTQTASFPNMTFSFVAFGTELIGIGVACAVITGIPCVAATAVAIVLNFFIVPVEFQLLFAPILAVLAYLLARLARGGG